LKGQNPNHTPNYTPMNGPIIYQPHFSSEVYISPNKNNYTIKKSLFPHNVQSFILVVCNGMQHWHLKNI